MKDAASVGWFFASLFVAACFVGLWQLVASYEIVAPVFLPGPDRTFAALFNGLLNGTLLANLFSTLEHVFFGWFLASLVGIGLGCVIGTSSIARVYVAPTLELFRPLPASALIPVAIGFLGLSQSMVLFVIGFGALWPMLLATIHGISSVEPRLHEVGQILKLSRMQFVLKVALPSAMPDILSGMRLSLTVALILAVVAEMLSGQEGLGLWILLAGRSFRAPDLFAGVILLGFVGFLTATLLSKFERRALRWRALS